MAEPLRMTFDVDCSARARLSRLDDRIDAWWPRGPHGDAGSPAPGCVLEPRVGGRIYERTPDGTEHEWGEVTAWEPPRRLGLPLAPAHATATTRPTSRSGSCRDGAGTRVEIEHPAGSGSGDGRRRWRERNVGGWTTLLPHYSSRHADHHLEKEPIMAEPEPRTTRGS